MYVTEPPVFESNPTYQPLVSRLGTRSATLLLGVIMLSAASIAWGSDLGFKGGIQEAYGPKYTPSNVPQSSPDILIRPAVDTGTRLFYWNQVATNSVEIDHTPVPPNSTRVFGEQFGPARTSRALAITQIAVFDAINAIDGGYNSYTGIPSVYKPTSESAAMAQAAHDTQVALYPSQQPRLDALLTADLALLPNSAAKTNGIALGQQAAAAILAMRANDGSARAEPTVGVGYVPSNQPGKWRPDPVSENPLALGAYWGKVTPFVLTKGSQFRLPPPPALTSAAYTAAYDQVQQLGGSAVGTSRTPAQTIIGTYWAYDGAPNLGTPPRLFNQLTTTLMQQSSSATLIQNARLLALVNTAMADAGIAAWDSKYYYATWRPVTGIRESDAGTGPTGLGDKNPATIGNVNFVPLGAPADYLSGPNFTPPFPAYPSGHATFGGALFQTLRHVWGTDNIPFTFVSDEYNGVTQDNQGVTRPLIPRSFANLTQAENEVELARVYLGVHWVFDSTGGDTLGHNVADYVFNNAFQPTYQN
jgi:hypothetical protein